MTALDPYRTLEIAPGASQPEIKRAYRRLAKLYHPDSAGERALYRFLAIQAAYETLVDEPERRRPGGRGATNRPAPAAGPAWQADADRARATREAYRARTRKAAGADPRPGPPGASAGRSTGPTPDPTAGPARGPSTGGTAGGTTGQGSEGPSAGTGGRSKRSNRRAKATIGSTSYDGADREPFDPAWEGATWYGAGSGTYWTINPKEYADPRKHGPEYLARSRRVTSGPDGATPAPRASVGAEATWASSGPASPPPTEPSVAPDDRFVSEPRPAGATRSWLAATLPGRIIVALIGWIPLGVAFAALAEAVPVCGGIGTACRDPLTGGLWLVDLAVIAVLLAVPRLGWIAACGTAAFFVVGILVTPILLAIGGARTPSGSATALGVVLVAAWFAGIALALSGRVDLPPWRRRVG